MDNVENLMYDLINELIEDYEDHEYERDRWNFLLDEDGNEIRAGYEEHAVNLLSDLLKNYYR